jgi:hypothetical protein
MVVLLLITVVDDGREEEGIDDRGIALPPARPPDRADTTMEDESDHDDGEFSW